MPVYDRATEMGIMREQNTPPNALYMPISYDLNITQKQKHYRRYYKSELELVESVMQKTPFNEYTIIRG